MKHSLLLNLLVRTPIYDRPPVNRWGTGRVTLLGDAAYATTSTLGQGACLAIESALVLAGCLRRENSVEPALRRYERDRQARTSRIIYQSWSMGSKIQWQHPLACWFRDCVIRWMPRRWHLRALENIIAPGCVDRVWAENMDAPGTLQTGADSHDRTFHPG